MASRHAIRSHQRRATVALVTALCLGGVALLLWTKMKIVGGVPKTAYAEPEPREENRPGAPDAEPTSHPRQRASAENAALTDTPPRTASGRR